MVQTCKKISKVIYLIDKFKGENDLLFKRGFGFDCFLLDIMLLKLNLFRLGFIQLATLSIILFLLHSLNSILITMLSFDNFFFSSASLVHT